ncbi:hypothetical protein [Rhizomicrobium electricum]|jgi:hypothetical protein|uniref:Glycosyltransferase 2-like domain-containing protein n=1 Tax=Rhizomicrobium electricum TaxID=480070 RepID=A0ABN1F0Q5_9PROT|nr:hypothetical protein [Rhizomicrobium electricum]NIJ50126.1 hypothetical protein [Rhizomicrobium electricum]
MTDLRSVKLYVATPCYGGMVTQRYMQCTCALLIQTAARGISVQLELLGRESLITRGRNALVATFLDDPDATHLIFVDADIGFEPAQVIRMLEFDQDVTAGMYPLKEITWDAAAIARVRHGEPLEHAFLRFVGVACEGRDREEEDGFVTATYAGAGFLMIKRAVFEKLKASYPYLQYKAAHTAAVPTLSPNQFAFFDCVIDAASGEYLSEDYAFCQRWRAIGGKIWLDTQSVLAHVGPHEFVGSPRGRYPGAMPA